MCAGPANANIRCVELQDLAEEYKAKPMKNCCGWPLTQTQLTPEANSALNDELARRRINNAERIRAFRDEEERRKEEQIKDTGSLFLIHPYGIGRMRFGKADRSYDPETSIEQFKTTVFVVLFWLPLIPTGTFLVERETAFLRNQMIVLNRLPSRLGASAKSLGRYGWHSSGRDLGVQVAASPTLLRMNLQQCRLSVSRKYCDKILVTG